MGTNPLTTYLRGITTPRFEQLELWAREALAELNEIEHDCDFDGHEWEFFDDSFDHGFGTEIVRGYQCMHCEAERSENEAHADDCIDEET